MTPEQRFDRLERIAKLFVKAGMRARGTQREHNEKITILLDAQVANEDRFAKLAESHVRLADSQAHSDRRLDALIDIVQEDREEKKRNKEGRNGNSSDKP